MKPFAVKVLIAINVIVFLFWIYLSGTDEGLQFMSENFLVSFSSLAEGRIWTLLTSAVSHTMLWHLFLNMYVLFSFGPIIEKVLGSSGFLKFYAVAGIVASLSHALVSAYLLDSPELPALGASGAISGVILLFSLLYPRQRILLLGLIPMPAAIGAAMFVGLDLWGLLSQVKGQGLPIGHGAHLGGAITGLVYYWLFLSKHRISHPEYDL